MLAYSLTRGARALVVVGAAALLGTVSAAAQDGTADEGAAEERTVPEFIEGGAHSVATIRDAHGSFVEWLETIDEAAPDRMIVVIGAEYPNLPMVAPEFVETHTPLETFLAVAEPADAPPDALLRHAVELGILPELGEEHRYELRARNEASLERFVIEGSEEPQSCSQAFRSWVGSVFGDSSCGNNSGQYRVRNQTHCISGCNHSLGLDDRHICVPALANCNIVQARDSYYAGRVNNWHGGGFIGHTGSRYRFLAANCQGNGPIAFKVTRGSEQFVRQVHVGHALIYVGGPWPTARARTNVTYGHWTQGIPASGPNHVINRMDIYNNSGPNDRAIMCGDIFYRRDMHDISSPSCHGPNVRLCLGSNCTSPCFYCAGGAC